MFLVILCFLVMRNCCSLANVQAKIVKKKIRVKRGEWQSVLKLLLGWFDV